MTTANISISKALSTNIPDVQPNTTLENGVHETPVVMNPVTSHQSTEPTSSETTAPITSTVASPQANMYMTSPGRLTSQTGEMHQQQH